MFYYYVQMRLAPNLRSPHYPSMNNPIPPLSPPQPPRPRGIGGRIRAYFLTGLVIAGPLAVTAWLVFWFVDTVDH